MNFDFGEVLRRAWQITWKHKVLWFITILPFLIVLFVLPIWFIAISTGNGNPGGMIALLEDPNVLPFIILFYVVFICLSIFLQIVSRASVTLGVYRVEADIRPVTFGALLEDGFSYFWRILGVSLLIGAVFIAFFTALTIVTAGLSALTMGLAAICIQPLFLLMIPLMLLVMAVMEQAEAAVVADGMGATHALMRGYELVRANLGRYILVMIVIYFGMNVLISLVMFPLMIPMSFFMIRNLEAGMNFNRMMQMQLVFGVVVFPLMALVQGVALTYMKSAMIVMYLRLTRPPAVPRSVFMEATA